MWLTATFWCLTTFFFSAKTPVYPGPSLLLWNSSSELSERLNPGLWVLRGGSLNKTELSTFRLCVVFVFVLPVNRGWQIRIMMGKKKNIDINQMWNQVRCSLSWLARVRTRPGGKEKEPGQAPLTAGGRENKGCWINQTQSSAWPEARGELACSKGSQEKGGTQSPTRNGLPDKSKHKAGPGPLWDYILASLLALLPNHLSAKNTGS